MLVWARDQGMGTGAVPGASFTAAASWAVLPWLTQGKALFWWDSGNGATETGLHSPFWGAPAHQPACSSSGASTKTWMQRWARWRRETSHWELCPDRAAREAPRQGGHRVAQGLSREILTPSKGAQRSERIVSLCWKQSADSPPPPKPSRLAGGNAHLGGEAGCQRTSTHVPT